jgi:hypothetical protein
MSELPDGDRPIWDAIWKTNVPQKVRNFNWRLATNDLVVQENRCRRNMMTDPTCTICGMEEEDGYHATMCCTNPVALRSSLREICDLPKEEELANSGKEWALTVLSNLNSSMRAKVMLIWWRAWHIRNNIIFGEGKCGIKS